MFIHTYVEIPHFSCFPGALLLVCSQLSVAYFNSAGLTLNLVDHNFRSFASQGFTA